MGMLWVGNEAVAVKLLLYAYIPRGIKGGIFFCKLLVWCSHEFPENNQQAVDSVSHRKLAILVGSEPEQGVSCSKCSPTPKQQSAVRDVTFRL